MATVGRCRFCIIRFAAVFDRSARRTRLGTLTPSGFYLFQIPGTHDLVRPVVKFKDGYPDYLEGERNEFFYLGDEGVRYCLLSGR